MCWIFLDFFIFSLILEEFLMKTIENTVASAANCILKLQYTDRRLSFHNIGSPLVHPKPLGTPPYLICDTIRVHRIHFR